MNKMLFLAAILYIALGVYMLIKARRSDESEVFDSFSRDIFFNIREFRIKKSESPILFSVVINLFYILGIIIIIMVLYYFYESF